MIYSGLRNVDRLKRVCRLQLGKGAILQTLLVSEHVSRQMLLGCIIEGGAEDAEVGLVYKQAVVVDWFGSVAPSVPG